MSEREVFGFNSANTELGRRMTEMTRTKASCLFDCDIKPQIIRALESVAEIQSQLQPGLLRLSAYFPVPDVMSSAHPCRKTAWLSFTVL